MVILGTPFVHLCVPHHAHARGPIPLCKPSDASLRSRWVSRGPTSAPTLPPLRSGGPPVLRAPGKINKIIVAGTCQCHVFIFLGTLTLFFIFFYDDARSSRRRNRTVNWISTLTLHDVGLPNPVSCINTVLYHT